MVAFATPVRAPIRRRPRGPCTCASSPTSAASAPPTSETAPLPEPALPTPPVSLVSAQPDAYPQSDQRFGFAALIGPSNSGKSTLLNRLVGQKVAIVTPKVQTTRCRIAGIVMYDAAQVAYLDTPGIFKPAGRLGRAMVKSAWGTGGDGDTISVVVDTAEMFHEAKRANVKALFIPDAVKEVFTGVAARKERGHRADICVCANKMDAIPDEAHGFALERLRGVMEKYGLGESVAGILPLSARHGAGVPELTKWVTSRMPQGPWLYPQDDLTDMPSRMIAAEVTREKAFMVLNQELPYEIAIETTSYKIQKDNSVRITQDILVSRDSQKRIVTGSMGSVVKKIGMKSREDLAEVFGTTVHLMLTVKVRGKWKDDKRQYEQWGLDYNA